MEYDIIITLNETSLDVDLSIALVEDDKVYYYLCTNDKETISKSGWRNESNYSFDLSGLGGGILHVKAFVLHAGIKYVKESDGIDYISLEDTRRFNEFCERKESYEEFLNIDPFHLYHMKQPYSNFCLLDGEIINDKISAFCDKYDFDSIVCNEKISKRSILIKEKNIDFDKEEILFSGIGRIGENLIVGNQAANVDEAKRMPDDQLGTFTYVQKSNGSLEVGTDYFGIGKIYYFHDENCFACGNNYHMLLILLKCIGKRLKINQEVVNAFLCKMNQPFAQRFCRECEVAGILILPVGKKILIDQEIEFVDTPITQMFDVDRNITNDEYLEFLEKGKEEILANTKAVLMSDNYNEILLELTGGLDSRVSYSAVTNFNIKDKKIFISTVKNSKDDSNQMDMEIAPKINSVYHFPWDNRSRVIKVNDNDYMQNEINSCFLLGGYYLPLEYFFSNHNVLLETLENEEKTICLSGAYGEICCRPYFSRNALNRFEDIEKYNLEQLLQILVNRKDILSMKTYTALMQVMKKELQQLPGMSYIEKYETQYLFYRNSFHFTTAGLLENRDTWSVLQSKNLYCLCRKLFDKKKDIKIQLDIITELNPILGCIPYEAEKDNLSKRQFLQELHYSDERFRNVSLELESKMDEWEEACQQMQEKTVYTVNANHDIQELREKYEKWSQNWERRFEILLHGLMQYHNGIFKRQFGIDVFICFCLKKNKTEQFYKMLYNKLLSLFLQLRIIDDDYNQLFKQ